MSTQPTSLRVEPFEWLAASLGEENPQPIFRDPKPDLPVVTHESLPRDVAERMGVGCGRRVLPYRMQDRYDRKRELRSFKGIVLENEFLKATFLPELGGRLISLVHRPTGRELLYKNSVFQPANLALRDAWFAGGIEWNIAHYGHAFHTCSPIFAAEIAGLNGSRGLRLYDFDRCKSLLWQIDFHLPPGAEFMYAFTRVINPTDDDVAMYWWTNTAVVEEPGVRVLAPATESIHIEFSREKNAHAYGQGPLPGLPSIGGADGTYPANLPFINEFFFQCQQADMPWEAALDREGKGFIEASTQPLNIRKMFCWGMHQGGKRWKEFLSVPGEGYLEIQAGLAPTQQHTYPMKAQSQLSWMQAFGYIEAAAKDVHSDDWTAAYTCVDRALKARLPAARLTELHNACASLADLPPEQIYQLGTGWGALESMRRQRQNEPAFPSGFVFPESSLEGTYPWLGLLVHGTMDNPSLPGESPGAWMTDPKWRAMLEAAMAKSPRPNWLAWLHLGVMKVEAFDDVGAATAFEESIQIRASSWAYRNLGALANRRGDLKAALRYYELAWQRAISHGQPDPSFAIEYLAALHADKQFPLASRFFVALPDPLRNNAVVRLQAAKVALELNQLDFVESVLNDEFASIREGARDITDLWFGLQLKRHHPGQPSTPELLAEVMKNYPPPYRLDFRVVP